jgi:dTDP-4-dehydrorhamnose reductase
MVGSSVKTSLSQLGQVTTTQRISPDSSGIYFDAEVPESIEKLRKEVERHDLLVYAAGLTGFGICDGNPLRSRIINQETPARISELCELAKKRFLFFSTNAAAEFDGLTVSQAQYAHEVGERGASLLGLHRYLAERMILENSSSLVLRLSKVAPRHWPLIQNWIVALRAGSRVHALEDHFVSPVKIDDLSEVTARLVESGVGGLVNASAADQKSYLQVARFLQERLCVTSDLVEPMDSPAGSERRNMIRIARLDTAEAELILGRPFPSTFSVIGEFLDG